ncbi:hypothetical protein QEG73_04220 [Chitinophagaceae bacterium 26-R-25]|nr:hypothetical protein [Chitinophagaceae bacterium 26-R-25]
MPTSATVTSTISGLVVTIEGLDYTAVPTLKAAGSLSDTLYVTVKVPGTTGIVRQISFADSTSASSLVTTGSTLTFVNNVANIMVTQSQTDHVYYVKMLYTPPPFMYFVKTSDKDVNGIKYYLNTASAQKIASGTYDGNFEGYIDLTATNWDNIGLIQSDKSAYFDYNGGWWPEQSSGSFTLTKETSPATGYYPCAGPWADWNWTNNNASIVSPGIWKVNYNSTTNVVDLLETQFAISGSAPGSVQKMTYNSFAKGWTLTTHLLAGSFRFTTIPVAANDPVVKLGEYGTTGNTGNLASVGNNIDVATAGSYLVTLDLSNAPYYKYSLQKQ